MQEEDAEPERPESDQLLHVPADGQSEQTTGFLAGMVHGYRVDRHFDITAGLLAHWLVWYIVLESIGKLDEQICDLKNFLKI